MNFNKTDGVLNFNDYRSFFKFINNYEGDLVVKGFKVYNSDNLIAVFDHSKK